MMIWLACGGGGGIVGVSVFGGEEGDDDEGFAMTERRVGGDGRGCEG